MAKQLQSPQKQLRTAAYECRDVVGMDETMSVDQPDDFAVALRQFHGSNWGDTFEAWKTGLHRSTLPEAERAEKASGLAL